jgi:hypothetical protein
VLAYKWSLIASAQISRTSKAFSKTMTMEQLLYAEKMAAEWLRKSQKATTTSIPEGVEHATVALSAASD